jgi:hypothetical protein
VDFDRFSIDKSECLSADSHMSMCMYTCTYVYVHVYVCVYVYKYVYAYVSIYVSVSGTGALVVDATGYIYISLIFYDLICP